MAIDPFSQKIHWGTAEAEEVEGHLGGIWRANYDGSQVEEIEVAGGPVSRLAVDHHGDRICYVNGYPGTGTLWLVCRTLVGGYVGSSHPMPPVGTIEGLDDIALDPVAHEIYYLVTIDTQNSLTHSGIFRLEPDGSSAVEIYSTPSDIDTNVGISIDADGEQIYWREGTSVRRCNLDGSGLEDVLTLSDSPHRIALGYAPDAGTPVPLLPFSGRLALGALIASLGVVRMSRPRG